jgi:hypothetical protein
MVSLAAKEVCCWLPGAGTAAGQLLFMDLRMVSSAEASVGGSGGCTSSDNSAAINGSSSQPATVAEQLSCCVVRCVEAHSKGGMSVMVAHPTAPLLATGTTSQVVKVWTDSGDVVRGRTDKWPPQSQPAAAACTHMHAHTTNCCQAP